jgi:hypothetical protein
LISEDTRSQGRKSLEILSISRDNHGLGRKKKSIVDDEETEKSAENTDPKNKKRVMLIGINGEKISKREKRRQKMKLLGIDPSNDKSEVGSKMETSNASEVTETWIRCLVVIRKIDAEKDRKSALNNLESIDPRSLIPQIDGFVAYYPPASEKVQNTMSCLPNIFKDYTDEVTEEASPEFDNFIFPGFRKRLFDATWRGGMECGFSVRAFVC